MATVTFLLPAAGPAETLTLDHGGHPRSAVLHAQPGISRPAALVILLHGAGGSGAQALERYGWRTAADREGFAVLSPDALPALPGRAADFRTNPRFWDDGSGAGRQIRGTVDDAGFLLAAVDAAAARLPVDRSRIFAAGHSSGSGMAQRLALDHAGRIAAIGLVSGHTPPGGPPARPVPVLMLAGALDRVSPIEGGMRQLPWGPPQSVAPARDTPLAWARFARCPDPVVSIAGRVTLERWSPCRGGSEVLYYRIADLGHQWPGGAPSAIAAISGPGSDAIDATAVIWRFFQAHPLPR